MSNCSLTNYLEFSKLDGIKLNITTSFKNAVYHFFVIRGVGECINAP